MKNHVFFVSNSPYYKKDEWKNDFFPNHPYVIRRWFLWFFKKINFFGKFFVQIYTFIKKSFFWQFFVKILEVENGPSPYGSNFFEILLFFRKKCFQSWNDKFFFRFQKRELKILKSEKGGGKSVHFLKHDFGITNRVVENRLFVKKLSSFKA